MHKNGWNFHAMCPFFGCKGDRLQRLQLDLSSKDRRWYCYRKKRFGWGEKFTNVYIWWRFNLNGSSIVENVIYIEEMRWGEGVSDRYIHRTSHHITRLFICSYLSHIIRLTVKERGKKKKFSFSFYTTFYISPPFIWRPRARGCSCRVSASSYSENKIPLMWLDHSSSSFQRSVNPFTWFTTAWTRTQ